MYWEELKGMVESFIPPSVLNDYPISIEISSASANYSETRIEIDNSKCTIFVTDI